jgi:hypothetical protein
VHRRYGLSRTSHSRSLVLLNSAHQFRRRGLLAYRKSVLLVLLLDHLAVWGLLVRHM